MGAGAEGEIGRGQVTGDCTAKDKAEGGRVKAAYAASSPQIPSELCLTVLYIGGKKHPLAPSCNLQQPAPHTSR